MSTRTAPSSARPTARAWITYVNRAFIEVSGYEEDELLGKNHNIVRHPDMPPEGFADLWACIKAGIPWRGLVKNRCKNGDFYWVEAYVTPITEDGTIARVHVGTLETQCRRGTRCRCAIPPGAGQAGDLAIVAATYEALQGPVATGGCRHGAWPAGHGHPQLVADRRAVAPRAGRYAGAIGDGGQRPAGDALLHVQLVPDCVRHALYQRRATQPQPAGENRRHSGAAWRPGWSRCAFTSVPSWRM